MNRQVQPASLHDAAHACLLCRDPEAKQAATRRLIEDWAAGCLAAGAGQPVEPVTVPGRPERPRLVRPGALPRRGLGTAAGRAALVHAVTHIEFNAINLALDAVYRFRDMPDAFYSDWLRVAGEEASHFRLLRDRLRQMGYDYGDFDAHNGLWEMSCETAHDPLVRMALVPRVLEARGLDVTPGMIRRLQAAGDVRTVEILKIIQREEIGHVAIGNRWYRHLCEARGVEPRETFRRLLRSHMKRPLRGPFDNQARLAAGFTEDELALLEELENEVFD